MKTIHMGWAQVLAVGLTIAACGGQSTTANDAGGTDSGGGGSCPAAPPVDGSDCTNANAACEYGANPVCLSTAKCVAGKWSVAQVKCAPPDPTCPATRESAAGQTCGTKDAYCNYDGFVCSCTNCTKYPVVQCSGALTWQCAAPNTTPGCPAARPNLGLVCTQDGLFCDYGCEPFASRKCVVGGWAEASSPSGCPISTRAAKTDIRYLDPNDRAHVAAQARTLRLSTWHYKDPALAKRERLGIILEDAPDAPSADMDKRQVDLYSYTSMVLALAQDQDREIKDLRARIDELEKRLPPPKPK
ncbi:hypothetical protein BH09MYX1_BH09MYX1_27540 [soil metagenome]